MYDKYIGHKGELDDLMFVREIENMFGWDNNFYYIEDKNSSLVVWKIRYLVNKKSAP